MSKEPVDSLDDLKGKRVWVPEGDEVGRRTMQAMAVTPIPLPITDVYTGLHTGALDIITMSSVGAVILQYHTKVKYVTDVPLVYTMGFMVISNKAFAKVSADDQLIVREVLSDLYSKYNKLNLEDDRDAKEALLNAGLKFVEPTTVELQRLESVLLAANLEMAKDGVVSLALYEEMLGHADEYRREHSASE